MTDSAVVSFSLFCAVPQFYGNQRCGMLCEWQLLELGRNVSDLALWTCKQTFCTLWAVDNIGSLRWALRLLAYGFIVNLWGRYPVILPEIMKRELCRKVPLPPDPTRSVIHKLEIALTNQGLVRAVNAAGARGNPPSPSMQRDRERKRAPLKPRGQITGHLPFCEGLGLGTSPQLCYIFHEIGMWPARFYWAIMRLK